ncbi:MAG TPA: Uma2 family endonuclease [Verrucomicrobiae bacterium]|jgi:Uma2 family endonuclease
MEAASKRGAITVEDYLSGELRSEIRHEFLGGTVYAMAGTSEEHNTIAGNLFAALHAHLRGKPCRVFMVDMKVRLRISLDDVFYYPDLMVACDPRDTDRFFKRYPKVLIEVLSPDTERTDRREKFLSYTGIETLEEYVLVAQDRRQVTLFRRTQQWHPENLAQQDQVLELTSLNFTMPLNMIYEGMENFRVAK